MGDNREIKWINENNLVRQKSVKGVSSMTTNKICLLGRSLLQFPLIAFLDGILTREVFFVGTSKLLVNVSPAITV